MKINIPQMTENPAKRSRALRYLRRKVKRRRDHDNCKSGWVGGNPRYADADIRIAKPTPENSRLIARRERHELVEA